MVVSYLNAREMEAKLEEEVYRRLLHLTQAPACIQLVEVEWLPQCSGDQRKGYLLFEAISGKHAAGLLGLARRFMDVDPSRMMEAMLGKDKLEA